MTGEAVRMDLLIAGDEVGAADAVCCRLMGIQPASIRHLRLARGEGMFPSSVDELTLNTAVEPFLGRRFVMKRAFLDWLSLLGFRSRFFERLFWESSTAGPLHTLLYSVRRNSFICRLLYGPAGSPPEWQPGAGEGRG